MSKSKGSNMIVTLTGKNSFLLGQDLSKRVADFVAEHTDMGLEKYDGAELDPIRMPSVLQSLPFLASKRMVVLRSPSAQKAVQEQLERLMGDIPDSTDLIIVEPALDKRTSYYKMLQKQTDFTMYDEQSEHDLSKWLVDQAKKMDATISDSDALYLVNRVGTNQALLANELQKLVSYQPAISRVSIDEMTEPTPQSSVFDLVDAAFAGNAQKVVRLYNEQRQQKVEPLAIMGMIAWQLHILALVKAAGDRSPQAIASEGRVSPYVVRKSSDITRRVSLTQLKQWVGDAYRLDVRLKSQPIDADDAMMHFLLGLGK